MNVPEIEGMSVIEEESKSVSVLEALQAIVKTIDDPSIANILADLELAQTLVNEFKANIAGLHPSIANVIKALF